MLNRDRALPDSAQPPVEWFIRPVASPCSNTSVCVCSAVSEDDERGNAKTRFASVAGKQDHLTDLTKKLTWNLTAVHWTPVTLEKYNSDVVEILSYVSFE